MGVTPLKVFTRFLRDTITCGIQERLLGLVNAKPVQLMVQSVYCSIGPQVFVVTKKVTVIKWN